MVMSRREQLAYMIGLVESGPAGYEKAVKFAQANGVTLRMHEGFAPSWFEQTPDERADRVSEWLMGQFLDMHDTKRYIACNSAIDISMSFLHGTY